jgi:hypothetical protein
MVFVKNETDPAIKATNGGVNLESLPRDLSNIFKKVHVINEANPARNKISTPETYFGQNEDNLKGSS